MVDAPMHAPSRRFLRLWICVLLLPGASYHSTGQWVKADNGLTNANVVALSNIGSTLFAGTMGGGVFISTDGGAAWVPRSDGLTVVDVRCLAVLGSGIFAGTAGGGVFFSSDAGSTWHERNAGLTSVTVYALAASGGMLFAGTPDSGMFRSIDSGAHWKQVNNGLGTVAMFALTANGADLFAGIPTPPGVARIPITDTVWTAVPIGLSAADVVVSLALAGPNIFAGTISNGIRRSTNSGIDWQAVNNGFTISQINCMLSYGTSVFAGMSLQGLYQTTDNGGAWVATNSGLPTFMNVNALLVSGTSMFAAGVGFGVYQRPLSELVGVSDEIFTQPAETSLHNAFPNPFNPVTLIDYTIAESREDGVGSKETKLVVYDLLGREVAVLVNEKKIPGQYTVTFNAAGLSSGVYIYRLSSGMHVESRKMVLMK